MSAGQIIPTTFSTRSEAWHTTMMKSINRYHSLGNVLRFEGLVDQTISVFLDKLEEKFVSTGKACSIDTWLHYYAWGVIGEVTFSHRLGFLETATDIEGLIKVGEGALDYFAVIGQIPWLDFLLDKKPVYHLGPPNFGAMATYSMRYLMARKQGTDGHVASAQHDFLDLFLEAAKADPAIDTNRLIAYMLVNVIAGADTTAIELRAVVYYLCTHPAAMKRLQADLDAAKVQVPVSWKACQQVPYLDAVVHESVRLHPAVALALERIVPKEGLQLKDGRVIPAGTIVGINPWVVHRDRTVYGEDADDFRPERWLQSADESDAAYNARVTKMRETDLTFGHGKRRCIGMNMALLEVHKVIATLVRQYDMHLIDPAKMKVRNAWFHRQWGMDVRLERR